MRSTFLLLLCFFSGIVSAETVSNYDDCILKYMQGVTSDLAARKISASCAAKFADEWEDDGRVIGKSGQTANNHNRGYQSHCAARSPDGKYCADRVYIEVSLKDDEDFVRRFKDAQGCPPISASSGPNGWKQIESCTFGNNRKSFTASIIGWTRPQRFQAVLGVEKKRK